MEVAEEAEGSLSVDLNENRQGDGGSSAALKGRSSALLVSGAPEAGKGQFYWTGNGRSFAREPSAAEPGLPGREILLDLVAKGGYLPARFADGCGLNGFTESPGQEEVTRGQGGGGPGAADRPRTEGEGRRADSDDGSPPEGSPVCTRTPCSMANGGQGDWTLAQILHGSCNVASGEEKVANGGFCSEPGSPSDRTPCDPPEDAPTAAPGRPELFPDGRTQSPERPLSEPGILEDEEGPGGFSLPARPLTLRTGPGLPVSLSCDATPLSPDQDGPFYFGEDGDLRVVLEAGRRQSAPDKVPEHPEGSDSKMMPKRFGIADFFTR